MDKKNYIHVQDLTVQVFSKYEHNVREYNKQINPFTVGVSHKEKVDPQEF